MATTNFAQLNWHGWPPQVWNGKKWAYIREDELNDQSNAPLFDPRDDERRAYGNHPLGSDTPIITFSADDIVSKYLELREFRKDQEKAFKERMQPYADAMEALERAADLLMKQTGQKALTTVHGTAFYSHLLSVTCEDRDKFMDFVFSTNSRQFLTTHIAKEAVQTYMEPTGQVPPGVKVQQVINVNFRKA